MLHAFADDGQHPGEELHALVLGLVAHLPPARMVSRLLAPARIAPRHLQMPIGRRQIHTSCHAGGITSDLMRPSVWASRTDFPSGSV